MNTNSYTPIKIEDEMRQSYMDYAMSVIVGRALPDVRDGLKPVQRRVIYAMWSEGLTSDKKYSKCAGVVGEVLKRLHPHGDSSVYEALVRLAQGWVMRYPLVDGQGNFGSVDGDPAAAYRYTECRMTALAESLLADIEKRTVDFLPNFDGSSEEPEVLPALIPNLLINGADGIAVGMATHIPPHNLTEVISGAIALIENPDLTIEELMGYIPGPDFPTAGIIHGRSAIISAYRTGRGVLQIRAKSEIETFKGKSREGQAIVITEIPFQVNKARLIEKIAELVNDKKIEGIARLRDESDRVGMRIVIELKRDAVADVILNQLYKLTPLQTSFGIINLAIVDGRPVICSLSDLLKHFISHRRDVVYRRTCFELEKAKERMHLLEGFRIALLSLDKIIALIRGADTPAEAKAGLISNFSLSEIQAQAILDLRLQKLTGMERLAVEQEHAELAKEIDRLASILGDAKKVDAIIVSELNEMKQRFGNKRRTLIVDAEVEIELEDMIADEEMVVTISHTGYAKRTSVSSYRSQKRGGKGVSGAASKDDDFVEHLYVASTLSYLLCFTTRGRLYWLKVYQIPEAGRTARGRALVNLLELKPDESITAILSVRNFADSHSVFMASKQGVVKRVSLTDLSNPRRGGIIASNLDDGDSLIGVGLTSGKDDIILATKDGMAIRFSEEDARVMGRVARGVRGIELEGSDEVVGMTVVHAGESDGNTLLTVCKNGHGKRSLIADYRQQNRGGKGLIDIKTDERNGPVVGVTAVKDDSGVMLITSAGKVIRINAKDVSVIGRNTKGVRLINLDPSENVSAIAHIVESESAEALTNGTTLDPIT
jgi:DNA gyrase subunit A